MTTPISASISAAARAVIADEEALLRRVQAVLARAGGPRGHDDARDAETMRALRDDAQATIDEDDLPDVLHELGVRQQLRAMGRGARLPDPRAPYLGHLSVEENGVVKDYLLGAASFVDAAAGVRIVDWRTAPVAAIFHRHRDGDDYEEPMPGRTAEGVVVCRRIVVIAGGALVRILGEGLALVREGGEWRASTAGDHALASGGAGAAARPNAGGIPALEGLDAEQRAAVDMPAETPLLVLGSAGSGKTTVALHRLAGLTTRGRKRIAIDRVKVVVPEEGLARLSQRLLEPLGVGAAQVQTIDGWAIDLATAVFGRHPICMEPPALVVALKRHSAFYRAVRARFEDVSAAQATFKRLRRRLAELLTDRGFLGDVVDASDGELSGAAVEAAVTHTMLQLAEPLARFLAQVTDEERKVAIDGKAIIANTPDALAGTVDVEDLPVLVGLRAWKAGLNVPPLGHLVLDEAEDFSQFELLALGKLLGDRPSVTLAGDEAQQTTTSFAGWTPVLDTIGVGDAAVCRLTTSYRCPRPVVELARAVLGDAAPQEGPIIREGVPVGCFHFPDAGQAQLLITGAVRDLLLREPEACVAIIARDDDAARRVHALIADLPEARLVLDGRFTFEPGVDVTDIDSVKGLEWDYVIVPDATAAAYPATAEARRRLHVAITRTSFQLWLVAAGTPSPLVASRMTA